MTFDQNEFDLRLEWGFNGVETLSPVSDVIIIVDIFSFSTSVDIAVSRRAAVYPFDPQNNSAIEFTKSVNGVLAGRSSDPGYSLSPASLLNITPNTRLVMPSQNGSAMSLKTGDTLTLCGCIRNCKAVAEFAMSKGSKIAIVPGGERWKSDNTLRPSFEDLVGAGSILNYLKGTMSPESKSALAVFKSCINNLRSEILKCSSGKELLGSRGIDDINLACDMNVSTSVPVLVNKAYIDASK